MNNQELFDRADYYKEVMKQNPEWDYSYGTPWNYMMELAGNKKLSITEEVIRNFHFTIYKDRNPEQAGIYRKVPVVDPLTGYVAPDPEDVEHLMKHFMKQIAISGKMFHPIEYAAFCHKRLIDIHPFLKGNKKTAMLLLNLLLLHYGYGIAIIPKERMEQYREALILSQKPDYPNVDPLVALIAECVIESEKMNMAISCS